MKFFSLNSTASSGRIDGCDPDTKLCWNFLPSVIFVREAFNVVKWDRLGVNFFRNEDADLSDQILSQDKLGVRVVTSVGIPDNPALHLVLMTT